VTGAFGSGEPTELHVWLLMLTGLSSLVFAALLVCVYFAAKQWSAALRTAQSTSHLQEERQRYTYHLHATLITLGALD
jgi:hypothetical protein